MKVAVFPAAGRLGSSVYQHLAGLIAPESLVLISRDPSKILQDLVDKGVEVRQADYDSPETLTPAFTGLTHLFLVSYPSIENDQRFEAHKTAIRAAVEASPALKHIFYTSLGFAGNGSTSTAAVMQAHLRTEKWLQAFATERDLKITIIREGIYSETVPMYTTFWEPGDGAQIIFPHNGEGPGVAWVAINDLGEASARLVKLVLDGSTSYDDRIVLLSGPRDWSLAETVALIGMVTGKEIALVQGSEQQYAANKKVVAALDAHGKSDVPRRWATVYRAIRDGETAVVNGELEKLLGRPAEPMQETLRKIY